VDFSLGTDTGRGMPGRQRGPTCRLPDFRRRSGCVPAEPYPPLKHRQFLSPPAAHTTKYSPPTPLFSF
jgi:hypothetical protein